MLQKAISLLFKRVTVVGTAIVAQLILLLLMLLRFQEYFIYFYAVNILISIVAVLYIISSKLNPAYKIAWIIPILLAPVFGGLVYLLCGGNRLSPWMRRRMEGMNRKLADVLLPDAKAEELLEPYGKDAVNQSRYLEQCAFCPPYTNTATKYYALGDDVLEDLLSGGVYGGNTEARRHSSLITLHAAEGKGERSLLRTVFPSAKELSRAYPYLEKAPWQLPRAWASRVLRYAAAGRGGAASAPESLAIGERRVALLRKYKVIR